MRVCAALQLRGGRDALPYFLRDGRFAQALHALHGHSAVPTSSAKVALTAARAHALRTKTQGPKPSRRPKNLGAIKSKPRRLGL